MRIIQQSVVFALGLCVMAPSVEAQFIVAPDAYRDAVQRGHITVAKEATFVELTVGRRNELQIVNSWLNAVIVYRPEKVDVWSFSGNEGDCEDYVIAKIDALVRRGWPRGALRIAYATTEQGTGHAVLAVTASSSILILDNRFSHPASVSAFVDAGYVFHAWEVPGNPNIWEQIKGNGLFTTALAKERS